MILLPRPTTYSSCVLCQRHLIYPFTLHTCPYRAQDWSNQLSARFFEVRKVRIITWSPSSAVLGSSLFWAKRWYHSGIQRRVSLGVVSLAPRSDIDSSYLPPRVYLPLGIRHPLFLPRIVPFPGACHPANHTNWEWSGSIGWKKGSISLMEWHGDWHR